MPAVVFVSLSLSLSLSPCFFFVLVGGRGGFGVMLFWRLLLVHETAMDIQRHLFRGSAD